MPIKANFKGCGHFLRLLLSLLILLLCMLSKGGIPVEQQSWGVGNKVLQIKGNPFCKNFHLGRFLSEDKNDNNNNEDNLNDSFENYEPQVPYEITRDELKKRIAYCGSLVVDKKKAHAAIYVYINYLRVKYFNMIRELKKTFLELASKNELPEELQQMHWRKCEDDLLKELLIMENISERYFKALMDNKVILRLQFNWTLGAHEAYWFSSMFEKELKWKKILSDCANNYILR